MAVERGLFEVVASGNSELSMNNVNHGTNEFSRRLLDATRAVFGDRGLTHAVEEACARFHRDVQNIQSGRGIQSLTLAIVGAKGQGKTWVARQLIRDPKVCGLLRSGDLEDDATTRLVWIGPQAPESLDPRSEIYHLCAASQMIEIGQPFVVLDTPGVTDGNQRAAEIASEALSLAPIKLLVIARDQLRAAANIQIARRIDGAVCIPVISSVEPEELHQETMVAAELQRDLRSLRDQLTVWAPSVQLLHEILVPDFEITGREQLASQAFVSQLIDRLSGVELNELSLSNTRESRLQSTQQQLRQDVAQLIAAQIPQLADAVERLNRESEQLPDRVLASLLGSTSILETGVRMRLRTRLVNDTWLIWFPYRTVMTTLNLTQGAWDRVLLAMAGSVPSLFGALTSWAKNAKTSREFGLEIQDGIRQRTQRQVEERLKPLCEQFHRAVMKMRPRDERRVAEATISSGMSLEGIDELQHRSQQIFDTTIAAHATRSLPVQLAAMVGVGIFWGFMAGPIVLIYREYLAASFSALSGASIHLENFPHPSSNLLITSVLLSILPLAIYCMIVLTLMLSRNRVARVAEEINQRHQVAIDDLKRQDIIRLEFEDELLQQAELLLNLRRSPA